MEESKIIDCGWQNVNGFPFLFHFRRWKKEGKNVVQLGKGFVSAGERDRKEINSYQSKSLSHKHLSHLFLFPQKR